MPLTGKVRWGILPGMTGKREGRIRRGDHEWIKNIVTSIN